MIALLNGDFSDIWVHVVGALVAAVAVDLYRSLTSRRRRAQRHAAESEATLANQNARSTPASRGCAVTLLSWICRFAIRLSAKLAVALGAAIAAGVLVDDKVQWVDGAVEGAISGTTLTVMLIVFAATWMLLPIRLFKR